MFSPQCKMGLHYNLNHLVFVLVALLNLHCLATDLVSGNFRSPQQSQAIQARGKYSFDNAYEKLETYNKTRSSRLSVNWKWKNAGIDLNNHNNANHFLRNLNWDTKEQTTTTPRLIGNYISLYSRYLSKSTTPSYIEFDYLDENQDQDQFGIGNGVTNLDSHKTSKHVYVPPSSVSYQLFKDPYIRQEILTSTLPTLSTNIHSKSSFYSFFQPANNFKIDEVSLPSNNQSKFSQKVPTTKNNTTPILLTQFTTSTTLTTTPNDRVKFFEIYDSDTLKPPKAIIEPEQRSEIQNTSTDIMPENVSQSADNNNDTMRRSENTNNNTEIEIKHNYKKRSFHKDDSAITNKIQETVVPKSLHSAITKNTFMFETEDVFSKSEIMTKTVAVLWSSYPFASVYVYKPTQTHCDAAGISPHWLIAAGSCLSRHALVHSLHARSAFVTYCGEHWRRPERIAYVKKSVVHPKFNPRDKFRRLLYNIGLIQVSNSMAASCQGWAPVVLMSHQFSTQPEGSEATAVGWGLDRYGMKDTTEKLPHWPLAGYKSLVNSNTCPGSSSYSTLIAQDGDGTSNVYCLLLPPYTKEDTDPVHGGLLLIDDKLVALYLQEERRSWGPQSAQYTGVWRLLPWVMDTAREPDDEVTFDV